MKVLFRAIKSKHKNWMTIADELKRTIDDSIKPELLEYFERITKSWQHKPEFRAMKRVGEGGISVYVYPTGENADIWKYVTLGTRPHPIRPRKEGGLLVFPWGGYRSYKPKTSLGGHYGGPGIVANPVTTILPEVNHPGNKAREFEKHIARWYDPKFKQHIRNAISRGVRRT